MYTIGRFYLKGKGVKAGRPKGSWLKRAAEKVHSRAIIDLEDVGEIVRQE